MAAPRTETAITRIRELIAAGRLVPGSRLPPEHELATQLGLSRNTVREAVRALVTTRVLDVRRGDGTYVTSLTPQLLLEGVGAAVELMGDDDALEVLEVRRYLEPAATALAARFGVPVCPHAGGVGLCELVVHLSAFDYVAVSGSLDGRMIEYVDHLHEHFTEPVRVSRGRYRLPRTPGYAAMTRGSLDRYRFPDGPVWAGSRL